MSAERHPNANFAGPLFNRVGNSAINSYAREQQCNAGKNAEQPCHQASLAEGLAIAEQSGLDMKLVTEALSTGAVASPQVIRHSPRMAARDFSGASFTAALRHKDAAYAVALAESLLPDVPVSRAAVDAYARAKAHAPDACEGEMIEIVSHPKAK